MNKDKKQGIKINGMTNKWSAIENNNYNGHTLYLMENDTYGDETEYVIIDEDNHIVIDSVYNGWLDLDEALETLEFELKEGLLIETDKKYLEMYITL